MKPSAKIASRAISALAALGIWAQGTIGFAQQPSTNANFSAATNFNSRVTPEMAALGSRGVRVHDPSTILKCNGEYWVFYTGRGVPSYHSKDLVTWQPGPPVFTNSPTWADGAVPEHRGIGFWAPDIMQVGDRYLLYYSVSTFGKKISAIGLATTPTLDTNAPGFGWTDRGEVVRSTSTNDFNTIDPAIFQDANGKLWLSFGSFWGGIKLIQLDPKTGKRIAADSPTYSLAHSESIEASYLYQHGPYYYLFVNWGICCRGVNSTYEIRVGRSKEITGPYLDQSGVDLQKGGGTLFLDSHKPFIGPGHAGIYSENGTNWFSCHFYDGTTPRGLPTLAILPLRWTTNDWPEIIRGE
jgi:arabinan endo-1,5-alpha-L-arabinosidase